MSFYSAALQGLSTQSKRLDAIAQNIANQGSTGRVDPEPGERRSYVPIDLVTLSPDAKGVVSVYAPNSPDANAEGLISAPDISLEEQLTGALVAKDNYIANAKILKIQNDMERELINIIS